jgi:hypothetical protein
VSNIGRDNPPDLAAQYLTATELDGEPSEGFKVEDRPPS